MTKILCVLGVLCGHSADAAVEDYIGKPIASVQLLVEGRQTTESALTQVLETRVGQPLSMRAVRESIAHLFSLGRFDDVRVDASIVEPNRVALRYDLSPTHPVTRIDFAGRIDVPGLDTGEIRKAVVDRYGTSPLLGRVAELRQTVTDVLREHGYFHPEVNPRAEIAHTPDRATLVFSIDPGPRTMIAAIVVADATSPPSPELLRRLGLVVGQPYQPTLLTTRIDRYIAERHKAGYYEAKLAATATPVDGDKAVRIAVSEDPGLRVRTVFTGDPIPAEMRAELVPIEREGSVDEDLLEDSTNRIEEYLRAQGYRDAVAPHTRAASDRELIMGFAVKKGSEYRVGHVQIDGNASIPLSTFEASLRLRDGQPFSEARLDADIAMIEDLYRRRGFVTAKAQSIVEPQRAQTTPTAVLLAVRLVITEGPQTLVGRVSFQGNASVEDAVLAERLGLQAGRPYFDTQLLLDRDAIQLHYVNLGFPNATVEANPIFGADRTRADPRFTIREGPRVFVDHVLVVGNVRTSTETITRELQIKAGDPLSTSAVSDSRQRLAMLGLFRRIQIEDLRHGDETTRDLVVTVEEAPATTFAYGGGFEVRLRVVRSEEDPGFASQQLEFAPRGSFEIGRRNFLGKNRSANLFTSLSLHPKDSPFFAGQIPTSDDATGFGFAEYRVLGQFREPKAFGTSADALMTATLEQQIRSSFNFARRGVSAEIARRVTRQIGVSASYQIQRTRVFDESINPSDKRLVDRLFPQVRLSSASASAIRDTRDDVIEPRLGEYFSASAQLAGRRIGSEVGFAKTFMRAQVFRAVSARSRVVVAGNASLGLATAFAREVTTTDSEGNVVIQIVEDLPASERFFAGGDTSVRGFALDTVGTPETLDKDGFPIGGNGLVVFNAEIRAPVRGNLSAVGFIDAGNVFARATEIDLAELRSAVGFGFRYKSPVGPIRVDLGFKVRREEIAGRREGLTALHISLGQAF